MNRKTGEPVEPCHETGAAEGEEELVELDPPEVDLIYICIYRFPAFFNEIYYFQTQKSNPCILNVCQVKIIDADHKEFNMFIQNKDRL